MATTIVVTAFAMTIGPADRSTWMPGPTRVKRLQSNNLVTHTLSFSSELAQRTPNLRLPPHRPSPRTVQLELHLLLLP
jgi:hypothetical protein